MKILSINRQYTENEDKFALNLDGQLTKDFMARIHSGGYLFQERGSVLIVERRAENLAPLSRDSVKLLQDKLDTAQELVDEATRARKLMLDNFSLQTGLTLD